MPALNNEQSRLAAAAVVAGRAEAIARAERLAALRRLHGLVYPEDCPRVH